MTITVLNVPYQEKEQAKALGARWSTAQKAWYVPKGVSVEAFAQWIPELNYNIKADKFYIARSTCVCWACHKDTFVYALAIPGTAKYLEYNEQTKEAEWISNIHSNVVFISYLKNFTPSIEPTLKQIAPKLRRDYSKTVEFTYWMNHCEHCGMKQGDFVLHQESDAPFWPITHQCAQRIRFFTMDMPIECEGSGYGGYSSNMEEIYAALNYG